MTFQFDLLQTLKGNNMFLSFEENGKNYVHLQSEPILWVLTHFNQSACYMNYPRSDIKLPTTHVGYASSCIDSYGQLYQSTQIQLTNHIIN